MVMEIVPADEARIAEVEAWLDNEESLYSAAYAMWVENGYEGDIPARGFRCNWDSTKRRWREGAAKVSILLLDDQAIGFLDGTDILEIRPDLRQNGYGRILADFMVQTAYDEGRSAIEIEIAPISAKPFWERMGFTSVPARQGSGGGIYAYRIFPRTFDLAQGERVPFSITFYFEKDAYKNDPSPFSKFSGLGERLLDGSIRLPERAYCFHPTAGRHGDYFVKIDIDEGKHQFFAKAKHEESKRWGVLRDKGYIYFVEQLFVPSGFT